MWSPPPARQHVCRACRLWQQRRSLSITTLDNALQGYTRARGQSSHLRSSINHSQSRICANALPPRHAYLSTSQTSRSGRIELSPEQMNDLSDLRTLTLRLKALVTRSPIAPEHVLQAEDKKALLMKDVLKVLPPLEPDSSSDSLTNQFRLAQKLSRNSADKTFGDFQKEASIIAFHRAQAQRFVEADKTKEILVNYGIVNPVRPIKPVFKPAAGRQITKVESKHVRPSVVVSKPKSKKDGNAPDPTDSPHSQARQLEVAARAEESKTTRLPRKRGGLAITRAATPREREIRPRRVTSKGPAMRKVLPKLITSSAIPAPIEEEAVVDLAHSTTVSARDLALRPLVMEPVDVPKLSFDLSRVLFNPGVYELQDPRSRVYNFDPYLAHVMPVSEFNYDALNKYITSSEDDLLRDLAKKRQKKYIGSSSSMTGMLQHFHYLLSAWRELNVQNLSKTFQVDSQRFTNIHRSPSAAFLRYRDGVYAVDGDKEYDTANILMSLGKSMEKLLTLEKDEFEQYRKSDDPDKIAKLQTAPEQYHYGEIENFLMRSQLDAYDPRLPGTGMFDLKTRAVAGVRMILNQHEKGMDYQIKGKHGNWESYEREYYDMIRSAFLKYSLQVRMGRMDGIFVAYHNIQRIFGFQYISLPEMDMALHGQSDTILGDQEFNISVKLLNDIFERVTAAFPEQTLRILVETRDSTPVRETTPYMFVFAEPISDENADKIQAANKTKIEEYERRIFNGLSGRPTEEEIKASKMKDSLNLNIEDALTPQDGQTIKDALTSQEAQELSKSEALPGVDTQSPSLPESETVHTSNSPTAGHKKSVDDSIVQELKPSSATAAPTPRPLIGLKVVVRNRVNGKVVQRPEDLTEQDVWEVDYQITEIDSPLSRNKYEKSRNRRATALNFPLADYDNASYYIRNLIRLSEEGAEWRRKMDEMDAQNGTVVLYNDGKADTAATTPP